MADSAPRLGFLSHHAELRRLSSVLENRSLLLKRARTGRPGYHDIPPWLDHAPAALPHSSVDGAARAFARARDRTVRLESPDDTLPGGGGRGRAQRLRRLRLDHYPMIPSPMPCEGAQDGQIRRRCSSDLGPAPARQEREESRETRAKRAIQPKYGTAERTFGSEHPDPDRNPVPAEPDP
ncbi:unnamed protein product [Diplocarpon coronariae]